MLPNEPGDYWKQSAIQLGWHYVAWETLSAVSSKCFPIPLDAYDNWDAQALLSFIFSPLFLNVNNVDSLRPVNALLYFKTSHYFN